MTLATSSEPEKVYKDRCGHCGVLIEYWPSDGTYRDLRYSDRCTSSVADTHEPGGSN